MIPDARKLAGEWRAVPEGPAGSGMSGSWRLSSEPAARSAIHLRGVLERDADLLRGAALRDLELRWLTGGVQLSFRTAAGQLTVQAQWAALHEPAERLYEALPLARLDPGARRFWHWIFRLVRIPGGRRLLGLVARFARGRTRA